MLMGLLTWKEKTVILSTYQLPYDRICWHIFYVVYSTIREHFWYIHTYLLLPYTEQIFACDIFFLFYNLIKNSLLSLSFWNELPNSIILKTVIKHPKKGTLHYIKHYHMILNASNKYFLSFLRLRIELDSFFLTVN